MLKKHRDFICLILDPESSARLSSKGEEIEAMRNARKALVELEERIEGMRDQLDLAEGRLQGALG
jgi:hypothetical protein